MGIGVRVLAAGDSVPGTGAADGPNLDLRRAADPQHPRAFGDRAAGGHHIVDQGNSRSVQRSPERERPQRVGQSAARVELGLRGSVAHPPQSGGDERYPEVAGRGAGQFQGLIEAALAQAQRVQRDRHDAVRRGIAAFGQGGGKQFAQQPGMAQPAVEFELAEQEVYRRLVAKRREGAVESLNPGPAGIAGSGPAIRQWQGAVWARGEIARQGGGATGAQIAPRRPDGSTQQAGGRQQGAVEPVQPGSDHGGRSPIDKAGGVSEHVWNRQG